MNAAQALFAPSDIELIADADSEYRSQITAALLRRGHRIGFTPLPVEPTEGLNELDLLVYEPEASDPDALHFCYDLRDTTVIPLLVIVPFTARSRGIQALELGADSFILAPFDRRELIARCEALIRRYRRW